MAGGKRVEIEYNNLKFGKVGDWFRGTLTDNTRQIVNQLSPKKEMQTIFEFKAQGGSFHNIEKRQVQATATVVEKGDFWSYITSKPAILKPMKEAKLGQIVGFRFASTVVSKVAGQDDTKIIEVFLFEMDPEYQGEKSGDVA